MKYSIMFKNGNTLTFESDTDIDMDQVFASTFQIDKFRGLEERGDWEGVTAWMPAPEQYDPKGGSTK